MNKLTNPQKSTWPDLIKRPAIDTSTLTAVIDSIFKEVSDKGDLALLNYTEKFDKVSLSTLKVTPEEIEAAEGFLDEELKQAIEIAKINIEKFHESQRITISKIETTPGVTCWQEPRPIEKVGLYIPGGSAPLFSTVLMLGVPAKIAGCEQIILCTPPNQKGEIHPAILYTADIIGIKNIFKVGGAQAIAAMSLGTETIPQTYKIFGPGNQYVTAAKQKAQGLGLAIDMPAGPSELLVVADETSVPEFVAADLLSQAEHGPDSQVVCIANSEVLLSEIEGCMLQQLAILPRRAIAEQAIKNSIFIQMNKSQDILDFVNAYAPEHLILCVDNVSFYQQGLRNTGSVFIGNYTPESAGDYASGTNHTLPTTGFARSHSGVNLDAFVKKITFQEITRDGLIAIGPAIEKMASTEELEAHKNAVSIRLKTLKR